MEDITPLEQDILPTLPSREQFTTTMVGAAPTVQKKEKEETTKFVKNMNKTIKIPPIDWPYNIWNLCRFLAPAC